MNILSINHKMGLAVLTASLLLTACSAPMKNTQSAIPSVSGNRVAESYINKRQSLYQGVTIASTNNACVDGFNFLKNVNQLQYSQYSNNYTQINQDFTFLSINKNIMDKDAKEFLSMALSKKMDTLCAKVQYAGFIGVKDKVRVLSSI